jgi:hypothetical protein
VQLVRDPARLAPAPARRLIVDLNLPGAVDAAAAWSRATGGEVVGSSPTSTPRRSPRPYRRITSVLARSRFVELLPELLAGPDSGSATALP